MVPNIIDQRKMTFRSLVLLVAIGCSASGTIRAEELPRDMSDQLSADASEKDIVDHLLLVRKKAGVSRALAIHFPNLDREKAYRIQMALLKRKESAGAKLVGWKMGGTKIAKPGDKLDPLFGFMLNSDEFESESTVDATQFAANEPIMEAEIGFWIGKDLPGPNVSREQLIVAIAGIGGASEIISARQRSPEKEIPLATNIAIADGLSHGGFILPKNHIPLDQANFDSESGWVRINGKVIARGKASDMMKGVPLDAVLSLANQLPKHGRYLRAGQVVIIGSLLDSPSAHARDKVEIGFSSFEPIDIRFE